MPFGKHKHYLPLTQADGNDRFCGNPENDTKHLMFLDESGINTDMTRRHISDCIRWFRACGRA